ncbi:MAG: LapA family protein [Candidatus Marinimicrobia bacterium]|nr:LapA family protein [Candidatus Neomarinimicrobiota bacterium]
MKIKIGISIVLALFAFIFITQNTETVAVAFLAWSIEMSLVLLVFIMLGAGIIIGWSLNSYLRFARNRKKLKTQENVRSNEVVMPEATDVTMREDKKTHE